MKEKKVLEGKKKRNKKKKEKKKGNRRQSKSHIGIISSYIMEFSIKKKIKIKIPFHKLP